MRYREIIEAAQAVHIPRLYHGTASVHLPSILKNGLTPQESESKDGSIQTGVYLTDSYDAACEYVDLACDRSGDRAATGIILIIDPTQIDPSKLMPDDYDLHDFLNGGEGGPDAVPADRKAYRFWHEVPWQVSLRLCQQVRYTEAIPPSAFKVKRL